MSNTATVDTAANLVPFRPKLNAAGCVPPFTDPAKARQAAAISNAVQAAMRALEADALNQGLPDEPYQRLQTVRLRKDIEHVRDRLQACKDEKMLASLSL